MMDRRTVIGAGSVVLAAGALPAGAVAARTAAASSAIPEFRARRDHAPAR